MIKTDVFLELKHDVVGKIFKKIWRFISVISNRFYVVIIPDKIRQYLKLPSVNFTRNIKITSRFLEVSEEF